jgi:hypothetical protein
VHARRLPVTVLFKRGTSASVPSAAVQVARDERDLGLGDYAPCAGHGLLRTEGTRRAPQQCLRPKGIAELRHRDAAKLSAGASLRRATRFRAPRDHPLPVHAPQQ